VTYRRYVPDTQGINAEFHSACVSHDQVCIQSCSDCGHLQHPPRYRCPACGSPAYSFEPQPGTGTCFSYIVTHRSTDLAWEVPYTTAVVQLDGGPRLIAAWEDSETPRIGDELFVKVKAIESRFAFFTAARKLP
jgi:uncharacterized OB-fold protein